MAFKRKDVEKALGYTFRKKARLDQAFTTKSFVNEKSTDGEPLESQDSLKTLGDAALRLTLIEILMDEGFSTPEDITKSKQELESEGHLATVFKEMNIPFNYFKKGTGERQTNRLYAETLESIVAAIYLDLKKKKTGNAKLKKIIKKLFKKKLETLKKS